MSSTCWTGVAATPVVTTVAMLLLLWALVGFGFSLTQTPIGRILNRSARSEDRPAVFAAQFALSHARCLFTYPLAGWVGASAGLPTAALVLAGVGVTGLVAVLQLWPKEDPAVLPHAHPELPLDHPNFANQGASHRHDFVIDDLHRRWSRAA